jgi:hypothetical protein
MLFGPGLAAGLVEEMFASESGGTIAALPCAAITLALVVFGWPGVLFAIERRRLIRCGDNQLLLEKCWSCGYSLAGLDSPVCPECGNSRVLILNR